MKRANIVKEMKIVHAVVSGLLFLSGLCLLIWQNNGSEFMRYCIGADFIVMGATRLLGYFANDLYRLAFQHDLSMGAYCAVIGVLIFIYPNDIVLLMPIVVGLYILLDGLQKLQTAFDAKAFGMKQWVGLLISSALVSLFGIFMLVGVQVFGSAVILIGVALMADGAENIWNTMATLRVRTKKENRFADEI